MELLDLLDTSLLDRVPDWTRIWGAAQRSRAHASTRELVVIGVVQRLCAAIRDECLADAVVLLRQLVRMRGGIQISVPLWSRIRERAGLCGLVGLEDEGFVALSARPWNSSWLQHSDRIDVLERRSNNPPSLGDGMLNAMRPAWTHYRSEAQKAAVDAWLFAPPGSTTLVTLPTGGGKSMCTILPAWFDSRGGRVNSGTTLVVVPTVALAFDQQKQASTFFRGTAQPQSRTGVNTVFERKEIDRSLRDGSIPILFTSPESLLGSRLHDACLDAVEEGLITRFVIDEAHLIETWGAGFRPEFQLLAALRRQMLSRSNGNLRTLLLSATVSESSREVLEQLFSEPGRLITIQANRLRPEIGYWFDFAPNRYVRERRVLEAIRYLPRPLILYVTRPDHAEAWVRRLNEEGYQRLAAFTGNTRGDERQELLDAWMSDKIDIMVGTSAFGLGVDKSDVRAIIHATLPENIDRFYQEVGRGGRDGYGASALLCTCPEDIDLAYSLSPKRITFEKAEPRWRAMLSSPDRGQIAGDTRIVDRDAVPHGDHREAVEVDRDWNDHILLILQRAGQIEIVNMLPITSDDMGKRGSELSIRIRDAQLLNDPDYFRSVFERAREKEKQDNHTDRLLNVVRAYSRADVDRCFGRELAEIYEDVQIACGGCPACRGQRREAYGGEELEYQVDYPVELAREVDTAALIADPIREKLGTWRSLVVTWSGTRVSEALVDIVHMLPALARLGFQQLIIPDALFEDRDLGAALVQSLAEQDKEYTVNPHRVLPLSWLLRRESSPMLPLPTVVVYPPDDVTADLAYQAIQGFRAHGIKGPGCIHIVHEALYLRSAGKSFAEHVDGLTESIETFRVFVSEVISMSY